MESTFAWTTSNGSGGSTKSDRQVAAITRDRAARPAAAMRVIEFLASAAGRTRSGRHGAPLDPSDVHLLAARAHGPTEEGQAPIMARPPASPSPLVMGIEQTIFIDLNGGSAVITLENKGNKKVGRKIWEKQLFLYY